VAGWRIVSAKTATVKLFGGTCEVGPVLTGRRIELVFDPRRGTRTSAARVRR
jgi:hypothetical protein